MTEWVLIIWTIGCGWSCDMENVREFAAYETEKACYEALLDWTITERSRSMSREYQRKHHDRGAQCIERPVQRRLNDG